VGGTDRLAADAATDASCCGGGGGGGGGGVDPIAGADPLAAAGISASKAAAISACDLTRPSPPWPHELSDCKSAPRGADDIARTS
jgi:hypothetical protein